MVGSMGCVSSIGLGLALSRNEKNIIAIRWRWSVAYAHGKSSNERILLPANLLHILLDNQTHDSTGGQLRSLITLILLILLLPVGIKIPFMFITYMS